MEIILPVGRQHLVFAIGLIWRHIPARQIIQQAKQVGVEEDCNCAVLLKAPKTTKTVQAGFTTAGPETTRHVYCLAACLVSKIKKASWLLVSPVSSDEPSFYVLAVQNGVIIPGFDCLMPKNDVHALIQQLKQPLPEVASNLIQDSLEALITKEPLPSCLLKPIDQLGQPLTKENGNRSRKQVFALACLVIVIVGGGVAWYKSNQDAQEALRLRRLALLAQQQNSTKAAPSAQESKPWLAQPPIDVFLPACMSALNKLPLSIAGWSFATATCTNRSVTANYQRDFKSSANLLAFTTEAAAYSDHQPVINGDSAAFTDALHLGVVPTSPSSSVDSLGSEMAVIPALNGYFQTLGNSTKFTLQRDTPSVVLALNAGTTTRPPTWHSYLFTVATPLSPTKILSHLGDTAAGLRLSSISVTLSGTTLFYTASGALYVSY